MSRQPKIEYDKEAFPRISRGNTILELVRLYRPDADIQEEIPVPEEYGFSHWTRRVRLSTKYDQNIQVFIHHLTRRGDQGLQMTWNQKEAEYLLQHHVCSYFLTLGAQGAGIAIAVANDIRGLWTSNSPKFQRLYGRWGPYYELDLMETNVRFKVAERYRL